MKPYMYLQTFVSCLMLLLFVNCSDEISNEGSNRPPDSSLVPPTAVQAAFEKRYPEAASVAWFIEKEYYLADFTLEAREASAWFNKQGDWALETVITPYAQVAPVVSAAFSRTAYADWTVKEAYILDRKELMAVYAVGVTKNQTRSNLYFTLYGDFIKVIDDVHNHTDAPVTIPQALTKAIQSLFTDPEIVDVSIIDLVQSEHSVGLIEDSLYTNAIFNKDYKWIVIFWDLNSEIMPSVVWSGFNASAYAKYELLRMRGMRTPSETTYLFYVKDEIGKSMIVEFDQHGQPKKVISRNHAMAKYLLMR